MRSVTGSNPETRGARPGRREAGALRVRSESAGFGGAVAQVRARARARAGSRGEAALIHRDLEPSNVMIADSGTIKVLDFGIAAVLDGGPHQRLARAGESMGTPAYMAPEQAMNNTATPAGDLCSPGCVLLAELDDYSGASTASVLECRVMAATCRMELGENQRAARELRSLLNEYLRLLPEELERILEVRVQLATLLSNTGETDEARQLLRQVLAVATTEESALHAEQAQRMLDRLDELGR
ncbi:protein kinase domain-containing protein [Actinopolyspora saharensis]|uniref:protein kinase domain-containing protein n=1 Tax=Actinopolyspora saharensis TaxID=995062 RepID=UPI003F676C7B